RGTAGADDEGMARIARGRGGAACAGVGLRRSVRPPAGRRTWLAGDGVRPRREAGGPGRDTVPHRRCELARGVNAARVGPGYRKSVEGVAGTGPGSPDGA